MKFSFVTPCAVGLALALSVGSVSAQQQTGQQQDQWQTQQRVQKDRVVREDPGVVAPQVARVNLRADRQEIQMGEDVQLHAEVEDAQGQRIFDRQVMWRSENPEVATVDQQGRVTAVSPGTATIVAEVNGQQQRTTITITERVEAEPTPEPAPEPAPEPTPEPPVVMEPEPVEPEPVFPVMAPRGAWYWGIAGGANFPSGRAGDTYDRGWNVTVPFGWDPIENAWGARVDLAWNQLAGRTLTAGATQVSTDNAQVWSATLNGTLRLPMMEGEGRTGPYALAGVGLHHLRNFTRVDQAGLVTDPNDPQFGQWETENTTRFGWNAGVGFAFGVGAASLFLEGRYVSVATPGQATNYVPVVLGITF